MIDMLLESLSLVTPLGICFVDSVTNTSIAEGLDVQAYPAVNPLSRTRGFATSSNRIVFRTLPGIDRTGDGDDAYWSSVARKPYVVEVQDTLGRFQPFSFQVALPLLGLFALSCIPVESPLSSPVSAPPVGMPLYSTAARQAPAGVAAVRADLVDAATGEPAAWAVLEVWLTGRLLARGIAGAQGSVVLFFHYPEPQQRANSSPPTIERKPFMEQTWPIDLRAFYTPQTPTPEIPDICLVLNQSPATLWQEPSPPRPLTNTTLECGKDLILRSGTRSTLSISPSG